MTLQLYILRQIVTALVFSVGGMIVIAVPMMAVSAIQRLGGAFVGPILTYLPLVFVDLVPYFLPIGFLLAVVVTYGRLAADNEWTAMCMAGFSPLRLLLPGLIVAAGLGLVSWHLATDVAPPVGLMKRELSKSALVQGFRTLSPGRTQFRFGDLYLCSRFRDGNEFREAVINVPGERGEPDQKLYAERLRIEIDERDVRIWAQGARTIHEGQDVQVGAITLTSSLDALFRTDRSKPTPWKNMKSDDLRLALAAGEVPKKDLAGVKYQLHHRDARLATCVMFLLLGAPTGLLLRRGTQLSALAAAVGYALLYYLLTLRAGRELAEQGVVPAWLGAWSSTLLGSALGLWLTWRIARR